MHLRLITLGFISMILLVTAKCIKFTIYNEMINTIDMIRFEIFHLNQYWLRYKGKSVEKKLRRLINVFILKAICEN